MEQIETAIRRETIEERRRRREEARRRRQRKALIRLAAFALGVALIVFGIIKITERDKPAAPFPDDTPLQTVEIATMGKHSPEDTIHPQEMSSAAWEITRFGCEITGTYSYPFNTMSQDWTADDLTGFCYHEIPDEYKATEGEFPPIVQIYTYLTCKRYGVEYEVVYALIERESGFRWNAEGDGGRSVGYMQISSVWHQERMERLGVTDLKNPFGNILVGVDYLAELAEAVHGRNTATPAADVLAAYNYGYSGAVSKLWEYGVHEYAYNREIMERANELKEEAEAWRSQYTAWEE